MKLNNPMFNEDIRKKVGNTQRKNYVKHCYDLGIIPNDRNIKKDIKETYEESIIRMKTNNPMFNKKTVENSTVLLCFKQSTFWLYFVFEKV